MNDTKIVIRRNGQQDSDELTHWLKKGEKPKYLKKIPIGNGKFKYIYAESKLDSHKPQIVSKPSLTSKVTVKTKPKAKITDNMKTDQIKKTARRSIE